MLTTTKQPLRQTVFRYAGVVQGLVALPCMIQLFCSSWLYFSHPYDIWYWFTTSVLATAACAGIIFTASVQWKALTNNLETLRLEIVKSVLATGLFLYVNPIRGFFDLKRLIVTGLAVVVLFYAPLSYAYITWKKERTMEKLNFEDNRRAIYTDAPEKTPLLREQN